MKYFNSINNFVLIIMVFFSSTLMAKESNNQIEKINRISEQIIELQNLIDLVGKERIGKRYFQQISESKAYLTQIKAQGITDKSNLIFVNQLYYEIENIIFPENKEKNDLLLSYYLNKNQVSATGLISGVIRHGFTGEALGNINVKLYDEIGNFLRAQTTGVNGRYFFGELAAGQYYVIASNYFHNTALITTSYPNDACSGGLGVGCQTNDLNTVHLSDAQQLTGVNIDMVLMPTIRGSVNDVNPPNSSIYQARISLLDVAGSVVAESNTNGSGFYSISAIPGQYYVQVEHSQYNTKLYDGVDCAINCDLNSGTLISIDFNQPVENIDFFLDIGAEIEGTLVDKITQEPLTSSQSGEIFIINNQNQIEVFQRADYQGHWNVPHLANGDYKIISTATDYIANVYPSIGCHTEAMNHCDLSTGLNIIHHDQPTTNIGLQQVKGTTISGRVVDEDGDPMSIAFLQLYDENLNYLRVDSAYTDQQGYYQLSPIGDGAYYLMAYYVNNQQILYPNIICSFRVCDESEGTLIHVNELNPVENINFNLFEVTGTISGTVTDINNNPLRNAYVSVINRDLPFNENSVFGGHYNRRTDPSGNYAFTNLPIGKYQVVADRLSGHFDRHLRQSYEYINCDDFCEEFTPIIINQNQVYDVDFKLSQMGKIHFNLIANTGSSNSINKNFTVMDANGQEVNSYQDDSDDVYVEAGEYYFIYEGGNFVKKVYGGENCLPECDLSNAALIQVSNDSVQSLTMNLDEHFFIELNNYNVEPRVTVYNQNTTVDQVTYGTNTKFYIRDANSKVVKFHRSGYYDQFYNGVNCIDGPCSLSQGELITPRLNQSLLIDLELLKDPNPIPSVSSISGFLIDNSPPVAFNGRVELLTDLEGALPIMTTFPLNNGFYEFEDVPEGNYYIRVESSYDVTTSYYGDISCERDCHLLSIPQIQVNEGQVITGQNIILQHKGTLSGSGIFANDGQPYDYIMKIYDEIGNLIHTSNYINNTNGEFEAYPLFEGNYRLVLGANINQFVYSAYPGVNCLDLFSDYCYEFAETIQVANGNNTHFNGFTILDQDEGLTISPSITGIIYDSQTDNTVEDSTIKFYRFDNSVSFFSTQSNENGAFEKLLPSGQYYVLSDTDGYIDQLYNGINCERGLGIDCILSQGESVNVDNNESTNVNFHLEPKPRLKIYLLDAFTDEPIISSIIRVFDEDLRRVTDLQLKRINDYFLIENLDANKQYYIIFQSGGYQIVGYPDVVCQNVGSVHSCESDLTSIVLSPKETREITIKSIYLRGINGYVIDTESDSGLSSVIVDFWNVDERIVGSVITSSTGGFSFRVNSNFSEFYVSTDTNTSFLNEIYRDIECPYAPVLGLCDITQGELVPISYTEPDIIMIELKDDTMFADGFD